MRALGFIGWLMLALLGPAAAADRPNILWIVSEDNSPDLGCYGHAQAHTPHLDRLAAEGLRYRHAFANTPVCSVARTTLITGVHATTLGAHHHRSAIVLPAGFALYPDALRAAGYYTTNNPKTDYNLAGSPQPWDASGREAHYRHRAPGQPFLAVFNIGTSHEGQVTPPPEKTTFRLRPAEVALPPYHPDTAELRRDWANYHDQLTAMDREAGAILAELEQAGLADDTIVFYFSDHGGPLPGGKRNVHERGTRVPLIVRVPPKWAHLAPGAPGGWIEDPVSFVDFPATLYALAGVPAPASDRGRAFLGRDRPLPRNHVLLYRGRMDERDDPVRAVRDRTHRYIRNYAPHRPWGQHYHYPFRVQAGMRSWFDEYAAGRTNAAQAAYWQPKPAEELYRLADDPFEQRNLIADPAHAATAAALRATLHAELLATRDAGFVPEAMWAGLAGGADIHAYAQSAAYPLERLITLAELAGAGDQRHLPALLAALDDPHPAIRYWGAVGCLVLQAAAAPAQDRLRALLADEWTDVRATAAEALGYLGEGETALASLTALVVHEAPLDRLAAMNAVEYLWRAGHAPLDRVQSLARRLPPADPANDRDQAGKIAEYLLAQP
jgi:N-sulfoglucosamine sulfohydrolase